MTLFCWFECPRCSESRAEPDPPCPKCGSVDAPREYVGDVRPPVAPPTSGRWAKKGGK